MYVHRSVGPSVRWSVGNAFVSAGRDEPANNLFLVYELVFENRISEIVNGGNEKGLGWWDAQWARN